MFVDSCLFLSQDSQQEKYLLCIFMAGHIITALVMVYCNVRIIHKFNDMSNNELNKTKQKGSDTKKEAKVTLIMLSLSISFIVLTIPQPILSFMMFSADSELMLLCSLGNYLSITVNSSVNLMLYYISGQTFRDELRFFFGSLCSGCRANKQIRSSKKSDDKY